MVKIAVCGAAGRMGQRIIVAAKEAGCTVSGALERPGHELVGQDAGLIAGCGALGVAISTISTPWSRGCDVLIDFTTPKVSLKNLEVCSLKKKAIVIGSTGFTPEERALAAELARDIPAVLAPTCRSGQRLLQGIEGCCQDPGDDFDVEIVELHHNKKKRLTVRNCRAHGRGRGRGPGRDYNKVANYHREGICGERTKEEIGMQTVRGGDIVGEHTVTSSAWESGSRSPTAP